MKPSHALETRRQRRSEKFADRIAARNDRMAARARMGVVSVPRIGHDLTAAESLSRALPQRLIAWSASRAQPSRLVAIEILSPLPRPGEQFLAQARRADGRTVVVNCRVARRVPWRWRTDVVTFVVMEPR